MRERVALAPEHDDPNAYAALHAAPHAPRDYFAGDLRRLLGARGLTAVERLVGVLRVVVGIEMLLAGTADDFRR